MKEKMEIELEKINRNKRIETAMDVDSKTKNETHKVLHKTRIVNKMNNTMVNQMVIDTLDNVVEQIRNNGNSNKSPKLIKKVGLALSVLTSDKGSLSHSDLNS